LAAKLCLLTGETLDVEEFMTRENVSRILDFWEAYDRVHALPDPWHQTAQICQQLSIGNSIQLKRDGDGSEVDSWKSFMPPRWVPPVVRPKFKVQTPEQQIAILESQRKGKQ
jgi:hypothetical protein